MQEKSEYEQLREKLETMLNELDAPKKALELLDRVVILAAQNSVETAIHWGPGEILAMLNGEYDDKI